MLLLLASWLAAANVLGLALAIFDKVQARRRAGRVPEAALLGLALLGGWLGEGLAFLAVRHKVRKLAFLAPFLLCAAANAILLAWVFL